MQTLLLLLFACRSEPTPPCTVWTGFLDQDADGYGAEPFSDCDPPEAFVELGGDCDDSDPGRHPGAVEICDGRDLDCDGEAQEIWWWVDQDQDGYGAGEATNACTQPEGSAAQDGDCDDLNPAAWPGAPEIWYDDLDQDCAGGDDWDQDGDTSPYPSDCDDTDPRVSPLVFEVCANGLDDDCNGEVDDCQFFGGVAPGDPALTVLGLKSSPYGEQQWTGDRVVPLGDLDQDGMGDFGVCADTQYNGGFHIFLSASLAGGSGVDLKDAALHLDEGCVQSSMEIGYIPDVIGNGQDELLAFGHLLYAPAGALGEDWHPIAELEYLGASQKVVLDAGADGDLELLYRFAHESIGFDVHEGPFVEGSNEIRLSVSWSSGSGIREIVGGDAIGDGVVDLLTVEEQSYPKGPGLRYYQAVDVVPGMQAADAYMSWSLDDQGLAEDAIPLLEFDVDNDGIADPVVYANLLSGMGGRVVGFGSAESPQGDSTFVVDFETSHFFTRERPLDLGDFNGDDHLDIAFAEPGDDDAGVVYLILGPLEGHYSAADAHGWITQGQGSYDTCDEAETPSCEHWGAAFGHNLRTMDYDGDGLDDLLIGAPYYEINSPDHGPGAAFIYLGGEGSPW